VPVVPGIAVSQVLQVLEAVAVIQAPVVQQELLDLAVSQVQPEFQAIPGSQAQQELLGLVELREPQVPAVSLELVGPRELLDIAESAGPVVLDIAE
jgi:hypothetical protein